MSTPHRFIWKIRWNILTLFLLMFSIASLSIVLFTYYKNYQGVLALSTSRMQIVSRGVIGAIDAMASRATLLVELTKGVVTKGEEISGDNEAIILYLLNAMNAAPVAQTMRIGGSNGNLIAITDLTLVQRTEAIPAASKYEIQIVTRTGGAPREVLQYRDTDGAIIGTKEVQGSLEDPRTKAWYSKVATWPHLHWSDSYSSATNRKVVNVSLPLINAGSEIYGVISLDVSLNQLSNIISHQTVGDTGRVFVLNRRGELLAPNTPPSPKYLKLLRDANNQFSDTKQSDFRLTIDEVVYLVNCSILSLNYEEPWLVVTIVPFNEFFGSIINIEYETLLVSLGIFLFFAIVIYFISRYISTPIVKLARDAQRIEHLDFQESQPIQSHIFEIATLATSFQIMRKALKSFGHYVPIEIIKTLVEQGKEIDIGGERGEVTVLFSDIEHFTTIAELLPVEILFTYTSEYFEVFSKIIVDAGGTIDKYIGDSIMALWNAPKPTLDAATKSCLAALRCSTYVKTQKTENPLLKGRTRFGIHSGEVIVGNIGTLQRMSYTAIGNVVNTAARLQALNKTYQTHIMITETIREQISSAFVTRPLDVVVVQGRANAVTIFELVGMNEGPKELLATPEEIALCNGFTQAYRQFHEGNVDESRQSFTELQKSFPTDAPTKLYLERLGS